MSYTVSYVGRTYGRLKVTKDGPYVTIGTRSLQQYGTSICECECGKIVTVLNRSLRTGTTKSCGCWNVDINRELHTKHGKSRTKEYHIWKSMIQRCTNPNGYAYKNYGGRGIRVCKRWMKFENFIEDMGECPPRLTLERINNKTGHYEKSNCKWDTRKVQSRNTRRNIVYTVQGKTACLKDLCEFFGKGYGCVYQRVRKLGWSVERAFA